MGGEGQRKGFLKRLAGEQSSEGKLLRLMTERRMPTGQQVGEARMSVSLIKGARHA